MDFDVKKNKILLFNNRGKFPRYSLHEHELEIVEEVSWGHHLVRYEVHCSYSEKAHDCEPATRYNQESIILGSYHAKLLAYQILCLPHFEYAAAAWDPSSKKDISDIEQLQDQAVRFIAGIKGMDGVEDAKTRLRLIPLH